MAKQLESSLHRRFLEVEHCSSEGRQKHTIVADLDGTLLRGRSAFPYFLLKVSNIEAVARAVLPKFYSEDVHSDSWRVFSACGTRHVITANPRIMVEHFARTSLGAHTVVGTEIEVTAGGYATGFVRHPGVMVGINKKNSVKCDFGDDPPEVGLGDRPTDYPFMSLCKEAYVVPSKEVEAVPREKLMKPIVFHDGRLVQLPTPLTALLTLLWLPIGFPLAVFRVVGALPFSVEHVPIFYKYTGTRLIVKGSRPPMAKKGDPGTLFVCTHRTLIDPVMVSVASGRHVTAVTYSISRISEMVSPIRTFALSRDREKDAADIKALLDQGDLCICPEGTTCREPFLLRFSALFAELSDKIVPVATSTKVTMFHGTTVRGWKGMDPFFFFMNPFPTYEVRFLEQLPEDQTVKGGKSAIEVANHIQKLLADALGYQCTNFTRKDKYSMLVGSDGTVPPKKKTRTQ
ncbi:hypothetical protein O6H91_01G155700 [Diphasiastrum complanatum]|uniref:Uncharacterized protein n=1 Tax=Diphasiastrum complanatum TaxID=34168 RepID=A0ACC2EXQ7_DIPCM|nr:hypothetical protein O6H91_01G155700 [Diphasiastrum complanatum]